MHQDALAHPYLADYHYPDDEPTAPRLADLGFEKLSMSKQELQIRMIRYVRTPPNRTDPMRTFLFD